MDKLLEDCVSVSTEDFIKALDYFAVEQMRDLYYSRESIANKIKGLKQMRADLCGSSGRVVCEKMLVTLNRKIKKVHIRGVNR